MKVVLAGPPRSGKSCLREGLKQALQAVAGAPYPYCITGCPDGEGAWFQATVEANPTVAAACKAAYKGKFTPEFVRRVADSVRDCQLPLVIVDIGGIPSAENEAICASATHIVILAGDMGRVAEWQQFARKLHLVVLAVVHSNYPADHDEVEGVEDGVLRGSVHHLERGEVIRDRPMVQALATHMVAVLQHKEEKMDTSSYKIAMEEGNLLRVGFGTPAQNDLIVQAAVARLDEMIASGEVAGGPVVRVNGPASLPVAMVLAHRLGHLFGVVACFDPKMAKYVVAISHDPAHRVGDLID